MTDIEFAVQIVLPLATTIATCVIGYLFKKIKQHDEARKNEEAKKLKEAVARDEALRAGLLALCRDRILQGYRYYRHVGGISTQDLETMNKLYSAYHALGGNGTITTVWTKINKLPLKEGED